jgi:hypothetical protein
MSFLLHVLGLVGLTKTEILSYPNDAKLAKGGPTQVIITEGGLGDRQGLTQPTRGICHTCILPLGCQTKLRDTHLQVPDEGLT